MKAVILAAGEGARMGPFTASVPKVMIPVGNRPILEYVVRALVESDGFAEWFATVSPPEAISGLRIGSRPARRGLGSGPLGLEDLRAIPWVFAWAQTRLNLPGWYGLGSGLAAAGDLAALRRAYAEWPLFAALLVDHHLPY